MERKIIFNSLKDERLWFDDDERLSRMALSYYQYLSLNGNFDFKSFPL